VIMADSEHSVDSRLISWVRDAIGTDLLAYILGCTPQALQLIIADNRILSKKQTDVLRELGKLQRSAPTELDEENLLELPRWWLTQVGDDGRSVARAFHEYVADVEWSSSYSDRLERAIADLAADAYPAFLLPPEGPALPMREPVSIRLTQLIFNHPKHKEFSAAVIDDPVLGQVFATSSQHMGRIASIYRNTGHMGGLQLDVLPDMLLHQAWRRIKHSTPDPLALAAETVVIFRQARRALGGEPVTATAKVAFCGVLLPDDSRLEFNNEIVLRPITDADRELAPDSLKGQLSGTNSSGVTTLINYDGDVLLEYEFPYKVRLADQPQNLSESWPEDMRPPSALERVITRIRFSLMLAVERDAQVQIVPTYRYFDEPLVQGFSISWADPRHGPGLSPAQLSREETDAWQEWYRRLNAPYVDKLDLALSRILRAIGERREPSDVLIDSVIAWESLFGTKEGEPTFRVTMCLAALLEHSFEKRIALRRKLGNIYTMRSRVVHGSGVLKEKEYPLCQEALDVAIRAVRILASERTDILKLPDGATRSATLLLGE
jgi:hypothetical protein